MKLTRPFLAAAALAMAVSSTIWAAPSAQARSAAQISREGEDTLHKLEAREPRGRGVRHDRGRAPDG